MVSRASAMGLFLLVLLQVCLRVIFLSEKFLDRCLVSPSFGAHGLACASCLLGNAVAEKSKKRIRSISIIT